MTIECGFWIASPYEDKVEPSEWWECVIPNTEHDGRDHLLGRQPMTEPVKRCRKCGAEKPVTEFYPSRYIKDGRDSYCRECRVAYNRAVRSANRERYREYDRARWERDSSTAWLAIGSHGASHARPRSNCKKCLELGR